MNEVLNYIWSVQKEFNKNFIDYEHLTSQEKQSLTKDYVLHMISESNSLLDEVNWKMHHKSDTVSINRRELILEWIDVFKYLLSIGLVWDITPEEFLQYFDEKSSLVEQRYLQEFSIKSDGQDVVICDIDGVLGDYPETFLQYVRREELKKGHADTKQLTDLSKVDNYNLYKFLEGVVSTEDLKKYKSEYRKSGEIRSEKVLEGAVEFLKILKSAGYYIVLLTSRPFDKYKNLYLDTYVWLKDNGLVFDMLLNDSKKRDKIVKLASSSSSIKFIVDDDPKIVEGLLGLDGLGKIYLVDKLYNRYFTENDKVVRVNNFSQILENEGVL